MQQLVPIDKRSLQRTCLFFICLFWQTTHKHLKRCKVLFNTSEESYIDVERICWNVFSVDNTFKQHSSRGFEIEFHYERLFSSMRGLLLTHYNDVIMSATASQITSLTIVYSTVYSDAGQRKHQSTALLAFVRGIHRGPVNSPHKGPVTRNMFPFDDVIMWRLLSTDMMMWWHGNAFCIIGPWWGQFACPPELRALFSLLVAYTSCWTQTVCCDFRRDEAHMASL